MQPSNGGAPLRVEKMTVGRERVEALVRVAAGHPVRTSGRPGLADEICALLPGMVRHRCECGSAHGIVAELGDTELPHLLEHVALELMVLSGSPRTLEGDTFWDFGADGRGVFRVSLAYDDDLVALAAIHEGSKLVEALLAGEADAFDVNAAVARIRGARRGWVARA